MVENAKVLAEGLVAEKFQLVTGGTDNHLILLDLSSSSVTGKDAEIALDHAGITVNKNTVPNEKRSPFVTSGVRIGTPALTTRGMGPAEMKKIAVWISQVIQNTQDQNIIQKVRAQVKELCQQFPIY